jgi:hypothetical protein
MMLSSTATAEAVRGMSARRAISPKYSPGPISARIFRIGPVHFSTRILPERI